MNYLFYVGCGEIYSIVVMWSEEERYEKWKLVFCWWREGKVKMDLGRGEGVERGWIICFCCVFIEVG